MRPLGGHSDSDEESDGERERAGVALVVAGAFALSSRAMFRRALFLSLSSVALLAAGTARAAPQRAAIELVYTRGPGAEACPDEQGFHGAVLRQMGYDPFEAGAPLRLTATIARRRGELAATMELRDAGGKLIWENGKLSDPGDCQTLVRAMGVVLAIQLDPEPAPAPAPAAGPPCPPAEAPKTPKTPVEEAPKAVEPPAPAVARRPDVLLGLGLLLGIEVPAAVAPGVSIFGAVRWPNASIALEGRAVFPGEGRDQGSNIKTSSFAAVVAPCGHWRFLFGCGLLAVGGLRLSGPDAPAQLKSWPVVAPGIRAGAEGRLSPRLLLRGYADLFGNMTHLSVPVPGRQVWTAPELGGLVGAAVVLRM
jgi:hypothetical protein